MLDTIRQHFRLYGYDPIETPAMENLSTLSGNYGEEGDRLLFKVLNNGDYLKDVPADLLQQANSQKVLTHIVKRGLRYDLTVPFARFIVMHRQELKFPFKRSAIQPVWRADRPQRGRYQEFYQCDADVAGSTSLVYEAELIHLYDDVFKALGLEVIIKWNNRKVLQGIVETAGLGAHFDSVCSSLDKLDKIGEEGVREELDNKGFDRTSVGQLLALISYSDLSKLGNEFASDAGQKGLEEMKTVEVLLDRERLHNEVVFDPSLARGLGYYTGCIFEVKARDAQMGSIGGGGRYDDLTALFDMKGVSGVGISFGVERIYDLMEEKELFPENLMVADRVLIACIESNAFSYAFKQVNTLRHSGVSADLYPESAKLQKQLSYANELKYAYLAIIGSDEYAQQKVTLKNMKTGAQQLLTMEEVVALVLSE